MSKKEKHFTRSTDRARERKSCREDPEGRIGHSLGQNWAGKGVPSSKNVSCTKPEHLIMTGKIKPSLKMPTY
jgi:hypothetical protein